MSKFCSILTLHKEIDFCAYAGNFNLIIKSTRKKNLVLNFDNLFSDVYNWCDLSGASLLSSKCKYYTLHSYVYRKRSSLRLLGIKWMLQLEQPHLIPTDLSSLTIRYFKMPSSSKMEYKFSFASFYGLQFFGYAPKSQWNKIDIINSSLRISLGIMRSSPIPNLRYESIISSLGAQRYILSSKLLYPLTNTNSQKYTILQRKPKSTLNPS